MTKKRDPQHPLKGFAGPISSPGKSGSKTGSARLKLKSGKKVVLRGTVADVVLGAVKRHVAINRTFDERRARHDEAREADLGDLAPLADRLKPKPKRVFGAYKGKFSVGNEFFEPLSPEDLKAWSHD
jgi:hypothetical protein